MAGFIIAFLPQPLLAALAPSPAIPPAGAMPTAAPLSQGDPSAAADASTRLGIIPRPQRATLAGGAYEFRGDVAISAHSHQERDVAAFLSAFLAGRGLAPSIGAGTAAPQITLSIGHGIAQIGREGYRLTVDANGATIAANTGAGLFYGLQTFEQLFPVSRASGNAIPDIAIVDWPAYRWRGIHLDVSRHFFGPAVVERYIDLAARYKLNTLHWHLTDDQGWRIPIAGYPKLTQVGACRAGTEIGNDPAQIDPHRYCGAYTRAQIRAVVTYAAARHITIVPEIEMPGHAVAALTAYPWLGCSRGPFHVRETWGVSTDIFCPTERTFGFVEHVLADVVTLFPGAYVHIGGDEVPKDAWQQSAFVHALMRREHLATYDAVQGYFTRRVEKYLASLGRKMIGWDEILDGGVSKHATVMSWRGISGGIIAARRGNDVVMTPDGPMYLDWAQGDSVYEPVAIDALSTPQMIYDFEPTPPSLSAAEASHILGVQGNLWTERITSTGQLFYMLLPRELAVAEDGWTSSAARVWSDFVARTAKQYTWLEAQHLRFRIPDPTMSLAAPGTAIPESVHRGVNETELRVTDARGTVVIADDVPDAAIYYTTDDTLPTVHATRYTGPLPFDLAAVRVLHIRAIAVLPSGRASAPTTLTLRR